ncbi:MAG: hypothetical protein HY000_20920 [Planctomycetes bacterium]|nr:hypothetical protein [Planctomycetota bacterium]
MKVQRVVGIVMACLIGNAGIGQAQYYDDDYGYHSSTAAEGYQRGMASVISSQGQYNLATSEAAVNMTQAQKQAIENNNAAVQNYYSKKQMNAAYNEAQKANRYHPDFAKLAADASPDRLRSSQLNPVTGEIYWPIALRSDGYAAQRSALERVFAERAKDGVIADLNAIIEAKKATDAMNKALGAQISSIPPNLYSESHNFLTSLSKEARLPAR